MLSSLSNRSEQNDEYKPFFLARSSFRDPTSSAAGCRDGSDPSAKNDEVLRTFCTSVGDESEPVCSITCGAFIETDLYPVDFMALGDSLGRVKLWDYRSGLEICEVSRQQGEVIAIAGACAHKNIVFAISKDGLKAWDLEEHQLVYEDRGLHKNAYNCLMVTPFSNDNQHFELVLAGSSKKAIHLWEFKDRILAYLGYFQSSIPVQHLDLMTFSNSQFVISSVKHQNPPIIEVWNLADCAARCTQNLPLESKGDEQQKEVDLEISLIGKQTTSLGEEMKQRSPYLGPRINNLKGRKYLSISTYFNSQSESANISRKSKSVEHESHSRSCKAALLLSGRHAMVACIKNLHKDDFNEGSQVIIAMDASDNTNINVWKTFLDQIESAEQMTKAEKVFSIRTEMQPFQMSVLRTPKPVLIVKLALVQKWEVWDIELGVLVREFEIPFQTPHTMNTRKKLVDMLRSTSKHSIIFSAANARYETEEEQTPAHVVVTSSHVENAAMVWDLGNGPKEIMREYSNQQQEWLIYPDVAHPKTIIPSDDGKTPPQVQDLLVQDSAPASSTNVKPNSVSSKCTFASGYTAVFSSSERALAVIYNKTDGQDRRKIWSEIVTWWLDKDKFVWINTISVPDHKIELTGIIHYIGDDVENTGFGTHIVDVVLAKAGGEIEQYHCLPHRDVVDVLYEHSATSHLVAHTCSISHKTFIVSASRQGTIKVYDLIQQNVVSELNYVVNDLHVQSMTYEKAVISIILAACEDNAIRIWDLVRGTEIFEVRNVGKNVSSVVLLPHSSIVCSSDCGRKVKLWDLSSGTCVKAIEIVRQNMIVRRILNVSMHKAVIIVLLQHPNIQQSTRHLAPRFADVVKKFRQAHLTTAQVWDMSNHIFGMGSLDSVASTVNLDLLFDQRRFSRTLHLLQRNSSCMPLLSFRLDALAQRSSPIVSMLMERLSAHKFFEHVFIHSPLAAACFIPLWKMEKYDLPALHDSNSDWNEDATVSLVTLFLMNVHRLATTEKDPEKSVEIMADAVKLTKLMIRAWNLNFTQAKKQSWTYMTLLACYLDIRAIVRHATLHTKIRRLHVQFVRGLSIYSVGQVLESLQIDLSERPFSVSGRSIIQDEIDKMGVPTKHETQPRYLVPIADDKIGIVEALQLLHEECAHMGPNRIFNSDIPDGLICGNWENHASSGIFVMYQCVISYYFVWIIVFTVCNAWFHELLSSHRIVIAWFVQSLVIVMLVPLVIVEVATIHTKKLAITTYLWDLWNLFSWFGYALTIWSFFARAIWNKETRASRIPLALANVILWGKLLWFLRGFKKAGPVVAFLHRTVYEMLWYIVLLFVIVIGFAESFFLLNEQSCDGKASCATPFANSWNSIFTTFVYMLGNVDENMPYSTDATVLTTILLGIFLLLSSILVINMIIARMTETFSTVQSNVVSYWRMEQAKIILEMYWIYNGARMMFLKSPSELDPANESILLNPQCAVRDPFRMKFITVSEESWSDRGALIVSEPMQELGMEDITRKMAAVELRMDTTIEKIASVEQKLEAVLKALNTK